MASKQSTPQVYILGNKRNIRHCLSQLTGTTAELSDTWTVYASSTIGKGVVSMKELKEHEMDCDDSINLNSECTASGKRTIATASGSSPHMKRLKSFTSSTNSMSINNSLNADIGYESDGTESEEKEEVLADINAVVLEEETGLNIKVAPFIFKHFTWPALIVFAIDSENFALELHANLIKELGILASVVEDKQSNLLIVGIPDTYTGEENSQVEQRMHEQRDKLHCSIFDSYFGAHFDWCEIDGLQSKVQSLLKETNGHIGRRRVDRIFEEFEQYKAGKRNGEERQINVKTLNFVEINTLGTENTALIYKNLIFRFKIDNKDYACKPDVLINEFMRTLTEKSIQGYRVNRKDFIHTINVAERKKFLEAFTTAGLIHILTEESGKIVHIMPLIGNTNIQDFTETGYSVVTNALRLSIELEIIPNFVKASIMKLLFDHGWILISSGPESRVAISSGPESRLAKESYLFVKQSHGLIVQFDSSEPEATSTICLCGLLSASQNERIYGSDYETIRNAIEEEIRKWKDVNTADKSFFSRYIKRKDNKDIQDILIQDEEGWLRVDIETVGEKHVDNVVDLLSPWFSSKVRELETELNRKMSDAFLSDISGLFGFGTKLFFVSQEIPSERLSQIEMENTRSTKDAVFQMLLEWRKRKELKANIAALRSAIERSTHVNVNLHDFDKIVNKHHEKS